jgi:hypothetical protein
MKKVLLLFLLIGNILVTKAQLYKNTLVSEYQINYDITNGIQYLYWYLDSRNIIIYPENRINEYFQLIENNYKYKPGLGMVSNDNLYRLNIFKDNNYLIVIREKNE